MVLRLEMARISIRTNGRKGKEQRVPYVLAPKVGFRISLQKEGYRGGLEPRNDTKSHHATSLIREVYGWGWAWGGIQRQPLRKGGREKEGGKRRHRLL